MAKSVISTATIPAFGIVKGGRLDNWRFHFLYFRVEDGALEIVARCTPPNWPFFREMWINHKFFGTLRPIVGQRAKRLLALPLIESAYRLAGLSMPAWIVHARMTLRALIQRTHGRTK